MRVVTIRDFQRKFYEQITNLPVTVTRTGKPLIVVTSAGEILDGVSHKREVFDKLKAATEPKEMKEVLDTPHKLGLCKVPGCFLSAFEMGKVYEDGNVVEIPMCGVHLKKAKRETYE